MSVGGKTTLMSLVGGMHICKNKGGKKGYFWAKDPKGADKSFRSKQLTSPVTVYEQLVLCVYVLHTNKCVSVCHTVM